jgi:hypothetical protein
LKAEGKLPWFVNYLLGNIDPIQTEGGFPWLPNLLEGYINSFQFGGKIAWLGYGESNIDVPQIEGDFKWIIDLDEERLVIFHNSPEVMTIFEKSITGKPLEIYDIEKYLLQNKETPWSTYTFRKAENKLFINKKFITGVKAIYKTGKSTLKKTEPSLKILSIRDGSTSVDLLGVGKILEVTRDTVKDFLWRGKHEKKKAEIEIRMAEIDEEKARLELEEKSLANVKNKIEILEKISGLPFSEKEKKVLMKSVTRELMGINKAGTKQLVIGEVKPLPPLSE